MVLAILACLPTIASAQQTSDSIFRQQMTAYGIRFTEGNEVKLLKSGQEKFDDMFHYTWSTSTSATTP